MVSPLAFSHFEYLIFNGLVFSLPFLFSFEKRIAFWKKWRFAIPAILLGSAPFVVWDIWAVGRHWDFNATTILGSRLAGLPLEEWLFFLSVPYASLFVWENVKHFIPEQKTKPSIIAPFLTAQLILLVAAVLFLFVREKEYLVIATATLGVLLLFSVLVFRTTILGGWRGVVMLLLFLILTTLANGYLTARPVVVYQEAVLTGWRIFRIPIEDFIFGLSLMVWVLTIYEYFLKRFSDTSHALRGQHKS